MRLLGSLMLLTGGLSAAAYAYFPVASFNEQNLAKLISIQAPAGREAHHVAQAPAAAVKERSFSPSSPLYSIAVADAGAVATTGSVSNAGAPVSQSAGGGAWRPIVTTDANTAPRAAGDYVAQVELARELQRELKRVGCYDGDADGDWKAASRRAMTEFLGKVNATLPVEKPDYILLTLLQGHTDRACGVGCPSGQITSGEGRCMAKPVIAQAPAGAAAVTAAAATAAAVSGAADRAPRAAPFVAAKSVDAARPAPPMPAPAVVAATPETVRPEPAREPLPGRMSVGAPVPALPPVAAPQATAAPAPRMAAVVPDDAWEPKRDVPRVRAAVPDRPARAERRVTYSAPRYEPPRRRKLTMTDLMRQLNGF